MTPYSWSRIHGPSWGHIILIPTVGSVTFDRWIQLAVGLTVFVFFGLGNDAMSMYRRWLLKMGFGKLFPTLRQRTQTSERRPSTGSETDSFSSRAYTFVKGKFARVSTANSAYVQCLPHSNPQIISTLTEKPQSQPKTLLPLKQHPNLLPKTRPNPLLTTHDPRRRHLALPLPHRKSSQQLLGHPQRQRQRTSHPRTHALPPRTTPREHTCQWSIQRPAGTESLFVGRAPTACASGGTESGGGDAGCRAARRGYTSKRFRRMSYE